VQDVTRCGLSQAREGELHVAQGISSKIRIAIQGGAEIDRIDAVARTRNLNEDPLRGPCLTDRQDMAGRAIAPNDAGFRRLTIREIGHDRYDGADRKIYAFNDLINRMDLMVLLEGIAFEERPKRRFGRSGHHVEECVPRDLADGRVRHESSDLAHP
jgi:hypothetical protein